MIGTERIVFVERLRPIVESLGWKIVKETYSDGVVLVTLLREQISKPSVPQEGFEQPG